MNKKYIHVVCAIIEKDHQILAAQRRNGEFAGMWEFPGGKLEPHETNEEALQREMQEEMNITVLIHSLWQTIEYEYPHFHLIMDCFRCTLPDGAIIQLMEHQQVAWVNKDQLLSFNWLPADVQIIEMLAKENQLSASWQSY